MDDYFLFQKFKDFIGDEEVGIDINLLVGVEDDMDVDGEERRRNEGMDKLVAVLEGERFEFIDLCGIGAGNPASQLIH